MYNRTATTAFLLIAWGTSFAQTPSESKSAADAWMTKDTIRIHFTRLNGATTTFETDVKAGKTNFIGSPDKECLSSGVPTKISYVEPKLVIHFEPPLAGCQARQYIFDPVSGDGTIYRPDGSGWVELQPAGKIKLVR